MEIFYFPITGQNRPHIWVQILPYFRPVEFTYRNLSYTYANPSVLSTEHFVDNTDETIWPKLKEFCQ